MRYEIFAPLPVLDEDSSRSISPRKMGTPLAVLLVQADQVVPREQLTTGLWRGGPPW